MLLVRGIDASRVALAARDGAPLRPAADAPPACVLAGTLAREGAGEALRLDLAGLVTALPGGAVAFDRDVADSWERLAPDDAGEALSPAFAPLDRLDRADPAAVAALCGRADLDPGLAASLLCRVEPETARDLVAAADGVAAAILFGSFRVRHAAGRRRSIWDTRIRLAQGVREHGWRIGEHTYGDPAVIDGEHGSLAIGRYCAIAGGVRLVVANHLVSAVTAYPFASLGAFWPSAPASGGDHEGRGIAIGHNVWIGAGATLLPGARVGDGAIIGAGAVVASEIPPFAIALGNPARIVRLRHPVPIIARLVELGWWHWPDHLVDRLTPDLVGGDVEVFLARAEALRSAALAYVRAVAPSEPRP